MSQGCRIDSVLRLVFGSKHKNRCPENTILYFSSLNNKKSILNLIHYKNILKYKKNIFKCFSLLQYFFISK